MLFDTWLKLAARANMWSITYEYFLSSFLVWPSVSFWVLLQLCVEHQNIHEQYDLANQILSYRNNIYFEIVSLTGLQTLGVESQN